MSGGFSHWEILQLVGWRVKGGIYPQCGPAVEVKDSRDRFENTLPTGSGLSQNTLRENRPFGACGENLCGEASNLSGCCMRVLGRGTCLLAWILLAATAISCGGSATRYNPPPPPIRPEQELADDPPPPPPAQAVSNIYLVIFENTGYSAVVGNPVMPYWNSLAAGGSLATNYFANTHPSIGNYFMLTTGQIVSNDDSFSGTTSVDNVIRELEVLGKTWKVYAESLPQPGYLGGDVYPYIKHHNPFAYFDDVVGSPSETAKLVPLSEFPADVTGGTTANYNFIVPNNLDNGHDCPDGTQNCSVDVKLASADKWLSSTLAPLLASSSFKTTGLLLVIFDEAQFPDSAGGGGHVAVVLIGSRVKAGFRSTTLYQHQSVLRLCLELLGGKVLPGAAANAPSMSEFIASRNQRE